MFGIDRPAALLTELRIDPASGDEDDIDRASPEWRMAYAIWTDHFARSDAAKRRALRLQAERAENARKQSTARFVGLCLVLSVTAVVTAIVMFEVLLWTMS